MSSIAPPPVPQHLREMLKDYPEHLERLQEVLTDLVAKPFPGVDPFDRAIWLLDGTLGTFIDEAKYELKAAKQGADPAAIEVAEKKVRLMFRASSGNGGMQRLDDLWAYCQVHQGSLS
jgi:hypothetical protein